MEGMEATTDSFINLIQNHRIIYDKSLKDFKNTRKKEEAWQSIAVQSRMTVDGAKRYASLRQKYSREKRSSEVKRRNKIAVVRIWVYYERLQFLDSFVKPRSTYTNDRFVEEEKEEDDDATMLHDDIGDEASGGTPQVIDIELEEGIEIDECGAFSFDDPGTVRQDCEQSDENVQYCIERVVSEYSQEESTIEYQSSVIPITSFEGENNTNSVDMELQRGSENSQELDANVVDIDNYVSQRPGTSSSFRNTTLPPYPSPCYDPKTGEIVVAQMKGTVNRPKMPPNNTRLNEISNSSQEHQSSSIQKAATASKQLPRPNQTIAPITSSAETTIRSNQLQSKRRSNQTIGPTISSTANIVPIASGLASVSSTEKRIDTIRQRMEGCLTAITNKVADKSQWSLHGPFLSYLGTRLLSVPKENLPKLERDILDLVDQAM